MKRLLILVLLATTTVAAPASGFEMCPTTVRAADFPSEAEMTADNQVMADLGARPTASAEHEAFISWIEAELDTIPGIARTAMHDEIRRWTPTGTHLAIGATEIETAGPVPYSKPATVSGPVVHVPTGTLVKDVDVQDRIVLRDVVPGGLPIAVFFAVAYYVHDPELTFDYLGNYQRDWISYTTRVTDLQQAAAGGALGVVFVHDLPRAQAAGHYEPYEGRFWDVPAVFAGVEDRQALRTAAQDGTFVDLQVDAVVDSAPTRTIRAVLPGSFASSDRIVVASHTDGMNAVWDNGPVAMLALARYLADLPARCRPRTFEFAFTSAHLYLSQAGAEQMAEILDHEYDEGHVALALALEHFGATEFLPLPRTDGAPGSRLQATGESELFAVFATESPVLVDATFEAIVRRDLRRTFLLRGADAPAVRFPPHHSYGGEGGPYHQHLVPTVAAITGPATLYKPAFGMETVDVKLMRRQTMAFGDLIHAVEHLPREVIAGADTAYRAGRAVTLTTAD